MQERTFKQLLMSSNYYTLNKQIVKTLGIEPAFLLTILIEASDGLADEEGWFYQTIETLEELTGLSRHKQNKIIQDLIDLKILAQENRGTPCRRYFKISYEEIENLVFKKPQTSLLKIDKLDCKNFTNYSVKNSQTSLLKINNNKEYIINNLNKELNNKESYSHDVNIIKELLEKFGINFSDKHRECVNELLKKNSVDYLIKHFTRQYEILKANQGVKNIAAVFSKHLFNNTCEVDSSVIEEIEKKQKELKQEENTINEILDIFRALPLAKQNEIENKILANKDKDTLMNIKKTSEIFYFRAISADIKKILKTEKLIL